MIVINEYLAIPYNVPQLCGILTWIDSDEPVQPQNKLRNSKSFSVGSLTVKDYSSDWQSSYQTACMHKLICGFAGRVYHSVGNIM